MQTQIRTIILITDSEKVWDVVDEYATREGLNPLTEIKETLNELSDDTVVAKSHFTKDGEQIRVEVHTSCFKNKQIRPKFRKDIPFE